MNAWKRAKAVRIVPAPRWIAIFIFAFGLGLLYAVARYPRINDSVAMVRLTLEQLSTKGATGNWYPARFEHSGVLRHDAARTQPGYTLYALAPDLSAHLIDTNGRELHQWSLSREDVMPGAARQPRTFFGMLEPQVEGGHLFSNGDLLLVYAQKAMGAWNTLLLKLDKDSRIIWRTEVPAHHAVEVVDDRIYGLTQIFKPASPTPEVPSLAGMPYLDESVSILDSEGRALSSHSLLHAFANTKNMRLADDVPFSDRIDALHSNSLDVLSEQTARFINVLLSLRNLNTLVVMDLDSDTIVWRELARAARRQDAAEWTYPAVRQPRRSHESRQVPCT